MTGTLGLNGVLMKRSRGDTHLAELEKEISRFEKKKLYRVTVKNDPKQGQRIFRFRILRTPPLEWGLIAGDCVHNYRSALDLLATALVRRYGTLTNATSFPLSVKDENSFKSQWGHKIGKLQRLPEEAKLRALIRSHQPYVREKAGRTLGFDYLRVLERLDAIDKHILLLAVGIGGPRTVRVSPPEAKVQLGIETYFSDTMDKGAVFTIPVYTLDGTPHAEVNVKVEPALEIVFDKAPLTPDEVITFTSIPLRLGLRTMRRRVTQVIDDVKPYLD
jgi:hypothetical protein